MAALRQSHNAVASVTAIDASYINLVPALISQLLLSRKIYPATAPAGDKLPSKLGLTILSGGEVHPIRRVGVGEMVVGSSAMEGKEVESNAIISIQPSYI